MQLLLRDPRVDPSGDDHFLVISDHGECCSTYPIVHACHNGYTELVRLLLLDSRVDPSVDDNDALHRAAQHNHLEVMSLLLQDQRVNPGEGDALGRAVLRAQTEASGMRFGDQRVIAGMSYEVRIRDITERLDTLLAKMRRP